MVDLLAKALKEASRLPEAEQVSLANWILEVIASGKERTNADAQTGRLAEDATVDYRANGAEQRFLLDEEGNRQSVVMPIEEYIQMLEDIEDLALIAERNDEPAEPLDAVLEKLRKGERKQ